MRIAIIGAGLAGLSCGARLRAAGHAVALFDKGRSPGGRMSHRRAETAIGEAHFDHGAQYFTARDPDFRAAVEGWARQGAAAPWRAAGDDAWVGTPGMNAPAKVLAADLDLRCGACVEALAREGGAWHVRGEGFEAGPFDAAVVAVPAEQAGALLRPASEGFAALAEATPSEPCWTVMAAFAAPLAVSDDVLKRRGIIGWAARDRAKPGRSGPEAWVVQAGPDWSREHLEDAPEAVVSALLGALRLAAGRPLAPLASASAHRWRYARSGGLGRDALWDAELGLGACGDWMLGPRVESAWVSGFRLAGAIAG